ncbi:MAG TPA: lipid II flippase MurJ, partial [Acetobacteraceae bacterium]|nr:lipid II flippase MurJ [Acetobacteraceae bacterium]
LARMTVAALAMAVVLVVVQRWVFVRVEDAPRLRWLALGALVGLGLAAYALAGQLLRAFDVRTVARMARRRRIEPV